MSDRKRQSIVSYDSHELQGEGSFVKVRIPTKGYMRVYGKKALALKAESEELDLRLTEAKKADERKQIKRLKDKVEEQAEVLSNEMIADHVFDWDWVGEDEETGEEFPLPIPKKDATVMDKLNVREIKFLMECIGGKQEDLKN